MKRFATLFLIMLIGLLTISAITRGGLVNGAWLKTAMTPLASLYLNAFNSPETAFALCLGMVFAAIVFLIYYGAGQITPVRVQILHLAEDIRGCSGAPGSEAVLSEIDACVKEYPRFAPMWAVFRATLSRRDDGYIAASIPPSRYFNMRMLEIDGLRLRFFLGLPGDFVGLGLMFTFMGLVAGLYFATQSMMSRDLGEARTALVLLLHAATFKFLTSVTGIGLSLVVSWLQGSMIDRLQMALYELQLALEERLPLNSAEPLPAVEPVLRAPRRVQADKPGLRHIS